MSAPRRVLIAGGGIAGWTVASTLRDRGFDGEIVIVEREAACYDRPPLSKTVLVDGAPLSSLAFAAPEALAQASIEVRAGHTVVALDAAARTLRLDDGALLAGDVIVLATGTAPRPAAFPGGTLPGVLSLQTYADARALHALKGRRIAVVGAGLIGAEATAALRTAGSEVTLIDPSAVPGTRAFGPTMAAHLHAMHGAAGVDCRRDTVAGVVPTGGALRVDLTGGDAVEVDGVLVATGVVTDPIVAREAGLDVDEGIVVQDGGLTSASGIYAVGDVARRWKDGVLRPGSGHWDAARADGQDVADAILGLPPAGRGADWFWSDRYGHHVEVVGALAGTAREVVRPGLHPTVFVVDGDRLVGAVSVDDPLAVRAARRLIDRRTPVVADQLVDPAVPVRSLLPHA